MPRHEEHAGGPYVHLVQVMLNAEGIRVLDKLRGETPRSTYMRRLLREEAHRSRGGGVKQVLAPELQRELDRNGMLGVEDI